MLLINKRTYRLIGALFLLSLALGGGMIAKAQDNDCGNPVLDFGNPSRGRTCYIAVGELVYDTMDNKLDVDFFLLYLGFDDNTDIAHSYTITLSSTRLTMPEIHVSTFYDQLSTAGRNAADKWYQEYSNTLDPARTFAEWLLRAAWPSGAGYRLSRLYGHGPPHPLDLELTRDFEAVPIGTHLGANQPVKKDYTATFDPTDRGAYVIWIRNRKPTKTRRWRNTGGYRIRVTQNP